MMQLILGGARSGKSHFAETQVANFGHNDAIYIATATANDEEMRARIAHHQQQRSTATLHWQLIEAPMTLASTLSELSGRGFPVLVDCLTLWLSNQLLANADMMKAREQLAEVVAGFTGELVLVSNEVGSGIVPMGQLSRQFVDQAGWLNQQLAAMADKVTLVVAGLPVILKE